MIATVSPRKTRKQMKEETYLLKVITVIKRVTSVSMQLLL